MARKETIYKEPDNYFPKELRRKFGLGEYAKEDGDEKAGEKKRKVDPDEEIKKKIRAQANKK